MGFKLVAAHVTKDNYDTVYINLGHSFASDTPYLREISTNHYNLPPPLFDPTWLTVPCFKEIKNIYTAYYA